MSKTLIIEYSWGLPHRTVQSFVSIPLVHENFNEIAVDAFYEAIRHTDDKDFKFSINIKGE